MPLYLVGTPIGNLKDITLRALEVLKSSQVVVVEKWADSIKLLKAYDIKPEVVLSYDENNHRRMVGKISALAKESEVALITSAGMPGVSDPGARLVVALREAGVQVLPIPGPSALSTAIGVSGFAGEFHFVGFLPRKAGQINKIIEAAHDGEYNVVFYESPFRFTKAIEYIAKMYPEAKIFVGREMTKKFEEYTACTAEELLERINSGHYTVKGEFVVILQP